MSLEPINLKMTNDARVVFETIAKLAGLSVIFDPDFTSRRITADLPNVTLEQALDDISLESKAFWKPLSASVIFVAPDTPQKRKDVEDEEVRTFYLSNTLTPQDLTEVVTGLRQLLDLRRVQQVNAQNAIVIRDTPDRLALAVKNHPRHRQGQARGSAPRAGGDGERGPAARFGNSTGAERLADLHASTVGAAERINWLNRHAVRPRRTSTPRKSRWITFEDLSGADYSATLPGATANAILTDNKTRIIQDPEVRVSDGEKATLKIGERVPVATGSFQAGGVGVGAGGYDQPAGEHAVSIHRRRRERGRDAARASGRRREHEAID